MASNHHKLLTAGTVTLIAEPALAMMHQGGVGVIVGLGIGGLAYLLADDIGKKVTERTAETKGESRDDFPAQPAAAVPGKKPTNKAAQIAYRVLNGRSVREGNNNASMEEPETEKLASIAMKTVLNIGPTLRPHVNSLFGSRTGIFGIPGSGKSNTVAVLLEELGEYECPLLILDTENENAELCSAEYFANPNRENAQTITPANAYTWGNAIMECNLQVVLNLQSYATDDDAAEVMIRLVQGINDWEEAQKTRVPCAIVLDEAHKWLPQNTGMSSLSKEKDDDGFTLLQKLQQCFLGTLASRGRKRGMGLIFATQRLAMLDKNLIMCEWLFLLRQTLPTDLKTYREMGCLPEIAQKLENGQAYVITPTKEHGTHQIRMRFSESGAKTPGLVELEEYKRTRALSRATLPTTMRLPDTERLEVYAQNGNSHSQSRFTSPVLQAENVAISSTIRERVNEPLERVNGVNASVNIPNAFTGSENTENANTKVSGAVKEQILKAIIAMQKEGLNLTRTGLRDYLKWDNRQYQEVLKPALDDMDILK